jgi:hypothetical protein
MRRTLLRALVLCGALSAAACAAPFPPYGTGGFAEHRPTLDPSYAWDPIKWADDPSSEPHWARTGRRWAILHDYGWTGYQINRLDCADFRLDGLRKYGAQERFPALVWHAKRERRIALRTLSGGLEWDGEKHLTAYENHVEDLAKRVAVSGKDIRDADPGETWRIEQCSPASDF